MEWNGMMDATSCVYAPSALYCVLYSYQSMCSKFTPNLPVLPLTLLAIDAQGTDGCSTFRLVHECSEYTSAAKQRKPGTTLHTDQIRSDRIEFPGC